MIEIRTTLEIRGRLPVEITDGFVALQAKDKEEFKVRLNDLREDQAELLVRVTMPCCQGVFEFLDHDALPEETLPCSCGMKGCVVVLYTGGE